MREQLRQKLTQVAPASHTILPDDRKVPVHNNSKELLLSYIPQASKHIVEFSGTGILKPGNLLTIIGHIGLGKSQVFESTVSSYLNPYVDTLGMRVQLPDTTRSLLWIDGERTRDDIAIGFNRIKKRIALDENPDLIANDRFKDVYCHPFIDYPNKDARRKELERLIMEYNPALVLLDGAGDFIRDTNDGAESSDFIELLISLANQFNFGVIISIHPNPKQDQDSKGRGHLGSELLRKSESVLLLKRAPDNRDVRILTMDFGHGKNRNAADNLEHHFSWSNEYKMFTSCNYSPTVKPGKAIKQDEVFTQILAEGKSMTYGNLVKSIVSMAGNSEPTAKKWIADGLKREVIFQDGQLYKLLPF